jgi:hypothetical protein
VLALVFAVAELDAVVEEPAAKAEAEADEGPGAGANGGPGAGPNTGANAGPGKEGTGPGASIGGAGPGAIGAMGARGAGAAWGLPPPPWLLAAGRTPCTRRVCVRSSSDRVKPSVALGQPATRQKNRLGGLCAEAVARWRVRLPRTVKVALHCGQRYGDLYNVSIG